MKLSVSVGALYGRMDFAEALKKIKDAGASAFEFGGWWERDLDMVNQVKAELGLTCTAFVHQFISLVDPAKRDEYVKACRDAIQAAKKLNCPGIITQVGNDTGAPREEQHNSLVAGLKACAPYLEEAGVTLLIEPLNTLVNHQGYYLWSSDEAFDIIREVNSPHVKVVFDIYHQQIMEGHLIRHIEAGIDCIAHFHAAGNPGRHELDNGEIYYPAIFEAIEKTGYKGYMGLEYSPLGDPSEGIKKLIQYES